jgi:hypothetical protein
MGETYAEGSQPVTLVAARNRAGLIRTIR